MADIGLPEIGPPRTGVVAAEIVVLIIGIIFGTDSIVLGPEGHLHNGIAEILSEVQVSLQIIPVDLPVVNTGLVPRLHISVNINSGLLG